MLAANRREFLAAAAALAGGAALGNSPALAAAAHRQGGDKMAFGLVTYLWGADWDLPTLLANCEKAGVLAVELRTTHAHGVEPTLDDKAREQVAIRFSESPVLLVGLGSDERFDHPEPDKLAAAIEATEAFVRLSHDVGGSGVKVKPDRFYPNVPREQTIAQIGKALHQVAEYALGFGQQIRLEVHGQCAELPTIKAILDAADHDNVAVCWNSNPTDLAGEGLAANFRLVADRLGHTVHIHELDDPKYPYAELFKLLVDIDYAGYLLLEAGGKPDDRVAALIRQRELFEQLLAKARG